MLWRGDGWRDEFVWKEMGGKKEPGEWLDGTEDWLKGVRMRRKCAGMGRQA